MNYLLGIDFGGGASKATLLDTSGNIVAENTVEYPTYTPAPDACEQSPADWISALCENCKVLLAVSKISPRDILCVAVDSATHTGVVCDGDFRPLRRAIHWTDSRSQKQSKYLLEHYGEDIFQKTYHKPDTIWTLPQLLWLKENEPEVFSEIRYVFFEKDYIRYFLTGVFCTDYIEAEGSMLFDCNRMQWDGELCKLCGIDMQTLPPLKNPTDMVGNITESAAKQTGLFAGTPVVCGTTDTCMEIFASGAVKEKQVTVKLATAGRICVMTDKPYPAHHLVNYSHLVNGLWYPGTATKAAASSYRWYRDVFGGTYRELDEEAKKIPVGCEGLRYHPYINGELTPYADPALCGSFIGIRSTHTKGHFNRAVLEGVSLSLLDSKRYLDSLQIPYDKTAVLIGGGGQGALWAQITADVLGMTLVTTESSDSSLGSAMLAGVAVGVFRDAAEAAKICVKRKHMIEPNSENTVKYAKIFDEYKQVHDALAPIYKDRSR